MRVIEAELDMIPFKVFEAEHGLNGRVQQFFTSKVHEYAGPYTPMQTGTFMGNVTEGEDYILYKSPFSSYLWEGKKMVDPKYKVGAFPIRDGKISFTPETGKIQGFVSRKGVLKELTDIDLNYTGAPMRGPFWINRMWADKSDEIIETVQKFIESCGKNE